MKRLLFALLSLLLLLCACQKTPESPIVVGKNTEQMLEAAQREDKGNTNEEPIDLYVRLGVPARYFAELISKKEKLHVYVDAQVLLPDCELPIVRVKPAEFTLDQAKQFAQVLMGKDARYVQFDHEKQTAGAYKRQIEKLRAGILDWENTGRVIFDLQYDTKEVAEQALSQLMVEAANAPSTLPPVTPDFSWSKPQVVTADGELEHNNTTLTLWAMPDDSMYSWLRIDNSREFDGSAKFIFARDFHNTTFSLNNSTDIAAKLSISGEDAYLLAAQTLHNMSLKDFTCAMQQGTVYLGDMNEQVSAYHFIFTRQIDRVTETYTSAEKASDNSYNTSWYYEKIHILVDDKGVLYLEYLNPYVFEEIIMEETELLSFAQIQSIFEKMIVIVNNEVDDNEIWHDSGKLEYHITTVRLGLISIPEQNKDTGLLVPAWDFMGYTKGRMHEEHEWGYGSINELHSFLTINAIDGSIIERGF